MNLSHQEVWRAIDRLAQSHNLSVSGLAIKAGLDPTIFNPSKRTGKSGRKRWPSTESIFKILDATRTAVQDFIVMGEENPSRVPTTVIPLLDTARASKDCSFTAAGYPQGDEWESIEFPEKTGDGIYALEVSGDGMEPVYRNGDRLIVSPQASKRRGDRLIVLTADGKLIIGEYLRGTAMHMEITPFGGRQSNILLSLDEIGFTARIIWVSQ